MRLALYFGLAVLSFNVSATEFGLGIVLGEPTGISANYRMSPRHSIDGAVAWDLSDDDFHLHSDYLWLKPKALRLDEVALDVYFGVGGRMVFIDRRNEEDNFRLGVRGPVGLSYMFDDPRVEVFGELALTMNLIESTSIDLDGGLGARYYF